jgi:hypothetical protein
MKTKLLIVMVLIACSLDLAYSQGTAFRYQGSLTQSGAPATGLYSLRFALYDSLSGGSLVGAPQTNNTVAVSNGLFTVTLDFGAGIFTGPSRWLEIGVKSNGVVGAHTNLTPRQALLPSPYSIFAARAGSAGSADSVSPGVVNSSSVQDLSLLAGDIASGQVVKSLNGLFDAVTLAVGPNLSLTPSGQMLTLDATPDWKLAGNAGTTPGTHFVGTLDSQDLVFKVNNSEMLRISTSADVILPDVPSIFIGFDGINGFGTYGQTTGFGGGTLGRLFGGYNVFGPVLYGEGGGGLGLKYRNGIFNPIQEKLTLYWATEEVGVFAQRGIKLQAYDGPIITRAWDPFNSNAGSSKNGLGRWGLFMEPGQLVCGIPDLDVPGEDRSFAVYKYDVNGFRTELMRVDNRAGFLMVDGAGGEQAYMGGDGFGGDVQIGSLNSGVQNVAFYNGASGTYMNLYARSLTIVGGADIAEPFAMSQKDILPGSVVVIDPKEPGHLKLSTDAYDKKVAGVVSGAGGIEPGLSMIQADKLEAGKNVALTGRVYVQADASSGAIEPGDLLTTAGIPGCAMKALDHARAQGAILGKAMTSLEKGRGLVLVLVTLQ